VEGQPDRAAVEEAAKAFGLRVEWEGGPPELEIYPDHWEPLSVIQAMGTQWNITAAGAPLGLRYEAMPFVLRMLGIPRARQSEVFEDVRVLESEMARLMRARMQ
jgi:hypothetical protein